MAEPQDSATIVFEDISSGIQTQYHDGLLPTFMRRGNKTNRWFMPTKRRLTGKVCEVTVEYRPMRGARVANDIFATMPTPRNYALTTYNVTIDETAANNDLHRVATAVRVSHPDILRARNNPHEKAALVQKLQRDAVADVKDSIAMHRHLNSNSRLAKQNGTEKLNDNFFYASASAYTTTGADDSARIQIDTGSIAYFTDGLLIDVYASGVTTTALFTGKTVIDVNVSDRSIGILGTATDFSSLADNADIYISGEITNNIISFGQWFGGETTIYGVNRATGGNRWMIPTRTRVSVTATPLKRSYFDDLAIAMGYVSDDSAAGYAAVMCSDHLQQFLDETDESALVQIDPTDKSSDLFATYGYNGAVYRHPSLGTIALDADPYAVPGEVKLIRPRDWECFWGASQQFEWLPGELGIFYRMNEATASNAKSLMYQADGYVLMADVCTRPRWQGSIESLST